MKFLTLEEDLLNGDPVALNDDEIANLIKLVRPKRNDIFYDLGSGYGEIVRQFVKKTKVKKAHGIEDDIKRFLFSIEFTRDELTKKELNRIEFWRFDYMYCDFSDATIIYNGLDATGSNKRDDYDEIKRYNKLFKKKSVKIIKRDFPLIGYKPVKVIRPRKSSWFFMMKTPLENYRTHDYPEWLFSVFRRKNLKLSDIINYHRTAYKNRDVDLMKKDIHEFERSFVRMAKSQFDNYS